MFPEYSHVSMFCASADYVRLLGIWEYDLADFVHEEPQHL